MEYNFRPIGTYEDIMAIFARSEQRRYVKAGIVPPPKGAGIRWVVEPLLNAFGILVMWAGTLAGAGRMIGVHDKVMGGLAGKARGDFHPEAPELEETRKLIVHVEELTKISPAVLCLMSHPPVLPESLGLNVEMARQSLLALHSLRHKGHARVLIAIDAYALDMLGAYEEGLYAGFMGTYHLGLDRLAQHRLGLSRWLLGKTAWWRLPWRTSRYLAKGGSLAMVLSGGVPITSRVLYAAREFLWRLRKARPASSPSEVVRRLEKGSDEFARFRKEGLAGPGLGVWKLMEAWIVARLSGLWPVEMKGEADELARGVLLDHQIECFRACALAMGHTREKFEELLSEFKKEYARDTPYRERFFQFLLHRVLSRGRPIVILPLSHKLEGHEMKLAWGRPLALLKFSPEGLHVCRGPDSPDEVVPVDRFAKDFVASHYN